MINKMNTTPAPTMVRCLSISVTVKVFCALASAAAGLAAASCHRKRKKPSAFVPRRLVKMVTVKPLQRFFKTLMPSSNRVPKFCHGSSRGDTQPAGVHHEQKLTVIFDRHSYFETLSR